jgi:hypothetical protein
MSKNILAIVAYLILAASVSAQTGKPLKVRVVYNSSDADSSAVGPLVVRQFAAQPKLFAVVNGDDKDLAIIVDCYRATPQDSYSCYYVAVKRLERNQALLGGAVVVQKSVEEAATTLFTSMLQDVLERWNSTDRQMLIAELETCLALTESSCAVPDPLQAELKAKSINLSQYMRKGGLKL